MSILLLSCSIRKQEYRSRFVNALLSPDQEQEQKQSQKSRSAAVSPLRAKSLVSHLIRRTRLSCLTRACLLHSLKLEAIGNKYGPLCSHSQMYNVARIRSKVNLKFSLTVRRNISELHKSRPAKMKRSTPSDDRTVSPPLVRRKIESSTTSL